MNEIIEVLEEHRHKWEYYFNNYYTLIQPLTKEDVYNDVALKLFQSYDKGNIDMDNLKNYAFMTYRNHINELHRKSKLRRYDELKEEHHTQEQPVQFDIQNKSKIQLVVEKVLNEDAYKELMLYYEIKGLHNREHIINPYTNRPFNNRDRERYSRWRKKIKVFLENN